MKLGLNSIASSALLATVLVTTGCDDTSAALDERAAQERAELRAEVESLKADLKETKAKAEQRSLELKNDLKEAGAGLRDNATDNAKTAADGVVSGADKVDKAVAEVIRDDKE